MAGTNVMGIFEFPPNIFDKILDRFSQAVQDNKYQKLDYVFWRKLKTSKIRSELLLNLTLMIRFSLIFTLMFILQIILFR